MHMRVQQTRAPVHTVRVVGQANHVDAREPRRKRFLIIHASFCKLHNTNAFVNMNKRSRLDPTCEHVQYTMFKLYTSIR